MVPELSQQPLVEGPLVQAAATEVAVEEAEVVFVEELVVCLFSTLKSLESGRTEAPVKQSSKPMEIAFNKFMLIQLNLKRKAPNMGSSIERY